MPDWKGRGEATAKTENKNYTLNLKQRIVFLASQSTVLKNRVRKAHLVYMKELFVFSVLEPGSLIWS